MPVLRCGGLKSQSKGSGFAPLLGARKLVFLDKTFNTKLHHLTQILELVLDTIYMYSVHVGVINMRAHQMLDLYVHVVIIGWVLQAIQVDCKSTTLSLTLNLKIWEYYNLKTSSWENLPVRECHVLFVCPSVTVDWVSICELAQESGYCQLRTHCNKTNVHQ